MNDKHGRGNISGLFLLFFDREKHSALEWILAIVAILLLLFDVLCIVAQNNVFPAMIRGIGLMFGRY